MGIKRPIQQNSEKAQRLKEELYKQLEGTDFLKEVGAVYSEIPLFKSTKTLGNCRKVSNGVFKISLNAELVEKGTDKEIKATILHELIHTMPNCFNHKWQFKNKAWKYQRLTNLDATSHAYGFQLTKTPKAQYKYKVVCEKCGQVICYRNKKSKVITHADNYRCKKCKGDIKILDNRK